MDGPCRVGDAAHTISPRQDAQVRHGIRRIGWVLTLLVVTQATAMIYAAGRHSANPDEFAHLAAGLHAWQTGSSELYSVNPPLVKRIAAIPAYLSGFRCRIDLADLGTQRTEHSVGRIFALRYTRSFAALLTARYVVMLFALVGTVAIFVLGGRWFSPAAGLAAAALWASSPWVMGYGVFLQMDVPAAVIGMIAILALDDAIGTPSPASWCSIGVWTGLLVLTKMSWLIALPLFPLLVWLWPGTAAWTYQRRFSLSVLILLMGAATIAIGYRFEGVGRDIRELTFASHLMGGGGGTVADGNRFTDSPLRNVVSLVPSPLLKGLDWQWRDSHRIRATMLAGQWYTVVPWYHWLGMATIKSRGVMVIALAGCILWIITRGGRHTTNASMLLFCLLMAVGWLLLMTMGSRANANARYLLPGIPFAILFVAGVLNPTIDLVRQGDRRWTRWMIPALIVVALFESAVGYPHLVGYANVFFGGNRKAFHWLTDSNVDWTHGWVEARDWMRDRAEPVFTIDERYTETSLPGLRLRSRDPSLAHGPLPAEAWVLLPLAQPHDTRFHWMDDPDRQPELILGGGLGVYAPQNLPAEFPNYLLKQVTFADPTTTSVNGRQTNGN